MECRVGPEQGEQGPRRSFYITAATDDKPIARSTPDGSLNCLLIDDPTIVVPPATGDVPQFE